MRTIEKIEKEMRDESVKEAPDDAKLYALQDERNALMAGQPDADAEGPA